ncbi:hypothetical protein [Prauserella flavalba]|uniref:Uncharacterized protein n=1 Tax=Prauserella flavalba TaxID=1477506 RepID=A0A318LL89_9PSEU|nr:hypothetical protein [Prauserella flavalba]PXY24536.1 hypothetical protein BA062_27225 [Prauserella flavalba]
MCETRRELHGDPEAMRRFAERLHAPEVDVEPAGVPACQGGTPACAAFTTADALSTVALADFLRDTAEAIATLKAAAATAAEDYEATDLAGAQAVLGVVIREV